MVSTERQGVYAGLLPIIWKIFQSLPRDSMNKPVIYQKLFIQAHPSGISKVRNYTKKKKNRLVIGSFLFKTVFLQKNQIQILRIKNSELSPNRIYRVRHRIELLSDDYTVSYTIRPAHPVFQKQCSYCFPDRRSVR